MRFNRRRTRLYHQHAHYADIDHQREGRCHPRHIRAGLAKVKAVCASAGRVKYGATSCNVFPGNETRRKGRSGSARGICLSGTIVTHCCLVKSSQALFHCVKIKPQFLSQIKQRGMLWSYERPIEAMIQHHSRRGKGAAAGSTCGIGEVRIGLASMVLGNGPEAPQHGRVFVR